MSFFFLLSFGLLFIDFDTSISSFLQPHGTFLLLALSYSERVEILAFPCNQFGQQEPEECPVIKRFAAKKGVDFTMMNKIDVNGPSASPVYKYLKNNAGPKRITWNFATYFIIGPDGTVQSFSGVEPMDLKGDVLALIDQEL